MTPSEQLETIETLSTDTPAKRKRYFGEAALGIFMAVLIWASGFGVIGDAYSLSLGNALALSFIWLVMGIPLFIGLPILTVRLAKRDQLAKQQVAQQPVVMTAKQGSKLMAYLCG